MEGVLERSLTSSNQALEAIAPDVEGSRFSPDGANSAKAVRRASTA
jgi:hypothetical protein